MAQKNTLDRKLKSDANAIFRAALSAADPIRSVKNVVTKDKNKLKIMQGKKVVKTIDLTKVERIFLVGAGKATAPMAKAIEDILGKRIYKGIISVKKGHALDLKYTDVIEAAHPVPDNNGVKAATQIKNLLEEAGSKDLIFSLISGGGSALLPSPIQNLKLSEKQDVTRLLLGSGADIHEMNTVRKHLSETKGGKLASAAAPASVINLMLSDVVGNNMDSIASGPFVPDTSTFEDMAVILAKYKLMKKVPSSVRTHLKLGLTGQMDETPKPGNPVFNKVINQIVGSNFISLIAAEQKAKELGYKPLILSSSMVGETQEVARVHVAMAREARDSSHPIKPPACLISGGETTVTLTAQGKGGRNQEFALAAAIEAKGIEDILIFSAGTDGTDGPTDAAGAMADGNTYERALEDSLSPHQHLQEHNAYPFFQSLDDLVMTGPTLTNVMDVRLVLIK